jgi:hypothetical protein
MQEATKGKKWHVSHRAIAMYIYIQIQIANNSICLCKIM